MGRSETAIITLEEAKGRFEEWRSNRRGKARIPAELWWAAIEVAWKEGINRTARELSSAARRVQTGDILILAAFCQLDAAEAPTHTPIVVFVDTDNRIRAYVKQPCFEIGAIGFCIGDRLGDVSNILFRTGIRLRAEVGPVNGKGCDGHGSFEHSFSKAR